MGVPKLGTSSKGKPMHYSVGALIKKDDKYLLVERVKIPHGFAAVAGHVDEGETKEQSLIKEVSEESNLKVEKYELLFEEEVENNVCSRGITVHYWYVFRCDVSGEPKITSPSETKSIGWYTVDEIKKLELENVWKRWFEKMNIL